MNRFRKIFLFCITLFLICPPVSAQEESDDSAKAVWSINVVSGKKNKVGKLYKGPFNNKEELLANWYYYELEPNQKYGILKNNTFVTKNPNAFFRSIWDSVVTEFALDREGTIAKYAIIRDKKIDKLYEKQENKSTTEKTATEASTEEKIYSGAIEVNQITYDENNDKYELEKGEPNPEPAPVKEPEQKTQPAPQQIPEPEPVPQPEPVPEPPATPVPEIDFSDMMNEIAKNPIQRYSREYIQDYIKPDIIPEPQDIPSSSLNIEDPNEADINGQTLLMKAAKVGNDWQIKMLLEAGADINLQDKDGWTALMYAVRYQESLNTIKLLLNAKADVKIKNKYDTSAVVIAACFNNNPELLETLLHYYSISDKEILKSFVLLLSTKQHSDYIQIAKLNVYLDKSIPLNNFYEGKTPLMYAAQSGNSTTVIKLLLDNGAATNIRSTDGKTVFDFATTNKNLQHDEIYWSLNRK